MALHKQNLESAQGSNAPLIVLLGPTASGKTALALELAEKFSGEIICADSRTVYRGTDIGTAKPTALERQRVPHHVLDVVDVSERFSAAEFKQQANAAIDDIHARGKIPFLVGGTGLYIDAVIFDYQFRDGFDQALRDELDQLSVEELQNMIVKKGLPLPENAKNKRYLIRTIETGGGAGARNSLRPNTLVLGVDVGTETLRERITLRVDEMIQAGFVDEYTSLLQNYSASDPGFNATGYKAFHAYMTGDILLDEAKRTFILNDIHLAKRQRTWFRRPIYQNSIHLVSNRSQVDDLVTTFLNK